MSTITKQQIHELILEVVQELVSELKFKKKDPGNQKDFYDPRKDPPKNVGRDHDKVLLLDKQPKSEEEVEILELDATLDETGEHVCEGCLVAYMNEHKDFLTEAKYQGREVPLGKPMKGDVKKSKVYVRDPKTGNVKKVNFGDPNMKIKRQDPKRRKSFRARHKCSQAKDRTTAKYWSCRFWSKKPVSKMV
jgi:hypothetical protein